jgi:hypothetical protein
MWWLFKQWISQYSLFWNSIHLERGVRRYQLERSQLFLVLPPVSTTSCNCKHAHDHAIFYPFYVCFILHIHWVVSAISMISYYYYLYAQTAYIISTGAGSSPINISSDDLSSQNPLQGPSNENFHALITPCRFTLRHLGSDHYSFRRWHTVSMPQLSSK